MFNGGKIWWALNESDQEDRSDGEWLIRLWFTNKGYPHKGGYIKIKLAEIPCPNLKAAKRIMERIRKAQLIMKP